MKNILLLVFICYLAACSKADVDSNTNMRLSASTDTLRFDTVFTTTNSITQVVKLFNTNDQNITITAVQLGSGVASPFQINVGGTPGPFVENISIAANDSTYLFVRVAAPQTQANTPFILRDSVGVLYNGLKKWIQLEAYGQNAIFLHNHTVTATEVWTSEKPYVLTGTCTVTKAAHLTIAEGSRVYAHANAPLLIEGQLTVSGNAGESANVIFTTNRLDKPYSELPGSWPGIVFAPSSHNNLLQHAVLKNAVQAITVQPGNQPDKLRLTETIITGASEAGILATGTNLTAQNLLISNCGKNIVLQGGGNYQFTHATIAAYPTTYLAHKNPILFITNATDVAAADLTATFRNSLFWGESGGVVPNEISLLKKEGAAFAVQFDGVLWPQAPTGAATSSVPITADPEFVVIDAELTIYDFHLKQTSPARNSGVPTTVSLDLDARPRPAQHPDLGAYHN